MADFEMLCKKIIGSNGNPSVQDVLDCGFSMEHFVKMSQQNVKAEKLVKNAREALRKRNIQDKEMN